MMTRELQARTSWTMLFGSALLGAAAMFLLDPDKGRRRRAIARDKARSLLADTRDAVGVAGRDASHRMRGFRARTRRLFEGSDIPDDLRLIERVRARMGRVVSHSHAVQVGANGGRVTLSGPILADEVERLLDVVRTVWGVSDIENRLVVHEHPESISSLQGGVAERGALANGAWPPAMRMGAMLGGSALALCALRERSWAGVALAATGVALALRGATNVPLQRLAGIATGRRAFELHGTIHVSASPEVVYDWWANRDNLPRFMSHVEAVRDLGEGRAQWIATAPGGTRLAWDVTPIRAIRPHVLSWRTDPGAPLQHAGTVRFEPFADGTRIGVRMSYSAGGGTGHALATMLGEDPQRQLDDELARMKDMLETRPPHDAAPSEDTRPPIH